MQPAAGGYTADMAKARLIALVILFAAVFGGGLLLGFQIPRWLGAGTRPKSYNTATLLRQVQTLAQLVTVKYVIEKVVVLEDVKWYGESRVLLLAQGVVKAGVDLSQIKSADLEVSAQGVVVRLPPPQITDVYLDDQQTRIIERTTGLLRRFDKDLEQTARQTAIDDISRAARRSGILSDAEERARQQLRNLFQQMGYAQVDFRSSPDSR